jgi:N-hydroxyarylamine O-acetyltransferase
MLDFDAYLRRIGLSGSPTVAQLHRAHAISIPFENLDPYRGLPVSLAAQDIERKLVTVRRGGYCFEQNLLLKAALEELGAQVQTLLARVRLGATTGAIRPRTHLVLGVELDGRRWLADVGFGLGTLLDPLPWHPGDEHEQSGWRFRLVEQGAELVLQAAGRDGWTDQYGFSAEPAPFVDLETSNWYTSTHPRSPFVAGPMAAVSRDDGSRSSLRDRDGLTLMEQTPDETTIAAVAMADLPELLAGRFGLEGFAIDPSGRLSHNAR